MEMSYQEARPFMGKHVIVKSHTGRNYEFSGVAHYNRQSRTELFVVIENVTETMLFGPLHTEDEVGYAVVIPQRPA